MSEVIFTTPYFTRNVWGGTRLRTVFHYDVEGDDIGECWGISGHPHGEAHVRGGEYDGMSLAALWSSRPDLFYMDKKEMTEDESFPILIKIIDAKDDLSIQVHPDNEYARTHEDGERGKTEWWYILDCPDNAMMKVGHSARSRQELTEMIDEGRWDELLTEIPVKKGDTILLPTGTLHEIGAGFTIAEVQESSDLTYRVYDFDRLWNGEKRKLHLEQAKDVLSVPSYDPYEDMVHDGEDDAPGIKRLISCDAFTVDKVLTSDDSSCSYPMDGEFRSVLVLRGEGRVNGTAVRKGDFFIITAGKEDVTFEGEMFALVSAAHTR